MYHKIILTLLLIFSAIPTIAETTEISGKDKIKYIGDLIIYADEVVNGDVVVMQGDLRVKGTVNGNAVVSFGDAFVDSGGVINGDLVALRGKINVNENATITGEIVESRLFDISFDDHDFDDRNRHRDKDKDDSHWFHETKDADVDARLGYNKVDGFFLGLKVPKVIGDQFEFVPQVTLHGFFGYGFSNDRWQYYAEFDKWFFEENKLEFGVEAHDLTDTQDNWIIENEENSVAAFLIHEDFRDYYYRRGFGGHIAQDIGDFLRLKVKYLADDYSMAENKTDWALFGGDKKFKENYSFMGIGANILPGMMRSIVTSGDMKLFNSDLLMSGSMEYADSEDIGGDFTFNKYIFEMKGFFDIGRFEGLDFRIRLGNSDGDLPPQRMFTLGGISTLRGFSHKEFWGEQMALANLEYRLFSHSKPSRMWFLKLFQIVLFADAGSVHPDIFTDFDTEYYKSDVGVGLMGSDDYMRFNIARRTDTSKDPWVVTFRIQRSF